MTTKPLAQHELTDAEARELYDRTRDYICAGGHGLTMVELVQRIYAAGAAAQARPAPSHTHDWKERWQQSLGEGEKSWRECWCGAKEAAPTVPDAAPATKEPQPVAWLYEWPSGMKEVSLRRFRKDRLTPAPTPLYARPKE